jgi:hypothetical protein
MAERQHELFYANPKGFVVKQLRARGSKDAVVACTIQEFVNSAVITTVIFKEGKPAKVNVVPDLRKFINILPNGEIRRSHTDSTIRWQPEPKHSLPSTVCERLL